LKKYYLGKHTIDIEEIWKIAKDDGWKWPLPKTPAEEEKIVNFLNSKGFTIVAMEIIESKDSGLSKDVTKSREDIVEEYKAKLLSGEMIRVVFDGFEHLVDVSRISDEDCIPYQLFASCKGCIIEKECTEQELRIKRINSLGHNVPIWSHIKAYK